MARQTTKADSLEALDREIDRDRDLSAKTKERRKALLRLKPTERFAKQPGGWFVLPATAVTVLYRKVSGLAQRVVIDYLLAEQFGREGTPAWVGLSCLKLSRLTSTIDENGKPRDDGFDAKAFDLALRELVDRKLIERRKAKESGRGYEYRTWPEEWADAKDPERLVAKTETADPADEPDADEPADAADPHQALTTAAVAPGKTAPWTRLEVAIPGLPSPAGIEVNWVNRTSIALAFATSVSDKGRVSFNITEVSPFVREVQFLSSKPGDGADYPTVVAELFPELWRKPFEPKSDKVHAEVLRNVLKFCGNAPASYFRDAVYKRMRRGMPETAPLTRCASQHQPRLLPEIAKDAAKSWVLEQPAPRPRAAASQVSPEFAAAIERVGPEESFPTSEAWVAALDAEMNRGHASSAVGD
ncbi:MAG TPA: hypothetical protein VG273_16320 [Bryobacteraceae bacterium]|jgi:hypothetical protein|nr:hypothetical protein [Bryobacteraceae bacterium]